MAARDLIIEALALLHEMKAEMTTMMTLMRNLQSGFEKMKAQHDLAELPAHALPVTHESKKRKREAETEELPTIPTGSEPAVPTVHHLQLSSAASWSSQTQRVDVPAAVPRRRLPIPDNQAYCEVFSVRYLEIFSVRR